MTQRTSKAKAAVAEKPKTRARSKQVGFRGLKFKLPPAKDVAGTILFDLHAAQNAGDEIGPVLGMLESFLGAEQLGQMRQQIAKDKLSIADTAAALGQLVNDVFAAYGMGLGEAPASQNS